VFQQVPEPKAPKNRWHFDLEGRGAVTSHWTSAHQRVKNYVERWSKAGAPCCGLRDEPDMGLYATAMQDPERQRIRRRLRAVATGAGHSHSFTAATSTVAS